MDDEKKEMTKNFLKTLHRECSHLTHAKVAEMMGISERQAGIYLNQSLYPEKATIGLPKVEVLAKLAKECGIPIESWLYGEEEHMDIFMLIKQLGAMIKELNVSVEIPSENTSGNISSVKLTVKDDILAKVILETYYAKNKDIFYSIVDGMARRNRLMTTYNKKLIPYDVFINLIRHDYIYQTAKGAVFQGTDEDGNEILATDPYTYDEMEVLASEWDSFSEEQKMRWYFMTDKEKEDLLSLSSEEKSVLLNTPKNN